MHIPSYDKCLNVTSDRKKTGQNILAIQHQDSQLSKDGPTVVSSSRGVNYLRAFF
jgi:hypothetical protein